MVGKAKRLGCRAIVMWFGGVEFGLISVLCFLCLVPGLFGGMKKDKIVAGAIGIYSRISAMISSKVLIEEPGKVRNGRTVWDLRWNMFATKMGNINNTLRFVSSCDG